jgi:hypothetical protein
MNDSELGRFFQTVRYAVVAVGIWKPRSNPLLFGTGFIVGNGERLITCAHVLEACLAEAGKPENQGAEVGCTVFPVFGNSIRPIFLHYTTCWMASDSVMEATFFGKLRSYNMGGKVFTNAPDVAVLELDVSRLPKSEHFSAALSTLSVAKMTELKLGTEVAVVGFPNPQSLVLGGEGDLPFNCLTPIVQIGRIGGIFPFPGFPTPHSIFVDVAANPGSSGSPVINLETRNVIGMIDSTAAPFIETPGAEFTVEGSVDDDGTMHPAAGGATSIYGTLRHSTLPGTAFALPSSFLYDFQYKNEGDVISYDN